MQRSFDVAVLGLGSMGTFACLEIARRKGSVIGFDRFAPPHDRGSHSGETRVYREAYSEHPDYVPLAQRAGTLWERLGEEADTQLLHRCGMLSIGTPNSFLLVGIRESAMRHHLAIEELSLSDMTRRFPAFAPPGENVGIFEPTAGWLDVTASIHFGILQARNFGAEIRLHCAVERWERNGKQFRIQTPDGPVLAERLIITAGAWAGRLLRDLGLPIQVVRKILVWLRPQLPDRFLPGVFPVFAFSDRFFYGFPNINGKGVKVAIHRDPHAMTTEADRQQPAASRSEIEPALRIATELLPNLIRPLPEAFDHVLDTSVCLYTMTPDEHFIVDRHPYLENVWIAAGFSGHGFKFAIAIGESLAELALYGKSSIPIGFLGMSGRFLAASPRRDC
jgi:sarcosine oxidase